MSVRYHHWVLVHCTLFLLQLAASGQSPAPSRTVATVGGEAITIEQVDRTLAPMLARIEEQVYNLRRRQLQTMIDERLLAKEAQRRGLSVGALLDAEVDSKVDSPNDAEVQVAIEQVKKSVGKEGLKKVNDKVLSRNVRTQLQRHKVSQRRDEFMAVLRAQGDVQTDLPPPQANRVTVSTQGSPSQGVATAPVTIVEFGDYHCPYCKNANATMMQLRQKFGDRVRLVYKDFPIDRIHPEARKAHQAARCAGEQEKFWEFNQLLYEHLQQTSPEHLKKLGEQVGLNAANFDTCLKSGRYRDGIEKDIQEGKSLGVNATPTFFVNGRMLEGALSLESFTQIVEEELKRTAIAPK